MKIQRPLAMDSEWLTRKQFIDPKLKAAGWRIVPYKDGLPVANYERCAVEEYPTENGPADYALCVGGKILGIVRAGADAVSIGGSLDLPAP